MILFLRKMILFLLKILLFLLKNNNKFNKKNLFLKYLSTLLHSNLYT